MIDLAPAPVPDLDESWIEGRRDALVAALSGRRRRTVRRVGLTGVTGIAATVATLLLVGGGETSAFAGWSPAPTTPGAGQLSSAETACQSRLSQALALRPTNKAAAAGPATYAPLLTDVRGPYTLTVLGDGGPGDVLCISALDATSLRWMTENGPTPNPGTIELDQISVLARDSQPYTLVMGQVGTGVTSIAFTLGDGTEVTATSGYGRFVAWWPGSQSIVSAAVTTSTGVSTQSLNLSGPPLPPSSPGSKTGPPQPASQSSCVASAQVACAG